MKKNCRYPDCEHCELSDCEVSYPKKRVNYWKNPEAARQATQRYREKKRLEQGRKTMKELQTERQDKIYQFIVSFTKEHLYPPSTVEIQEEFGIKSNSDVSRDLKRLEKRGLIKMGKGYRAYTLVGYKLVKEEDKMAIIDYMPCAECRNPECIMICMQCGKCGRKFEDGILLNEDEYPGRAPDEDN